MNNKLKRFKALIMVLIFAASLAGSWACYIRTEAYTETTGTVNGDNVNVRTGPGTSYSKITQVSQGQKVNIVDKVYTSDTYYWYKITFTKAGTDYEGYIAGEYVTEDENIDYKEDADFESWLSSQNFPESYKPYLRQMHAKYPKWVFMADHLDYDWNEAVTAESKYGRSLINTTAITSWKSLDADAYNWQEGYWYGMDGSYWVTASKEIVAYAMDPRNSLDTSHIFQFEMLSYNSSIQNEAGINSIIAGTFMENTGAIGDGTELFDDNGTYTYAQALIKAAQQTGVSPYHLATRIIQEMGANGASGQISGTYSGYEGYYNYYSQGAYAADGRSAVENGLRYAVSKGWNNRLKAIIEGAQFIGKNYIQIKQDTLYYEKFDFIGTPYTHQYMTYILASRNEALTAAKAYSDSCKAETAFIFKIPVFKNMPEAAVECPTGDGSPNNILSSLYVNEGQITPTFDPFVSEYSIIFDNEYASIGIYGEAADSSAEVYTFGVYWPEVGLNIFNIDVKAVNGNIRRYTINVVRRPAEVVVDGSYSTSLNEGDDGYITGITPGSTVSDIAATFTYEGGYTGAITNSADESIDGIIKTGDKIHIYDKDGVEVKTLTFVIYGDVNADGEIDSIDMLYIKRFLLAISDLSEASAKAADANHDGEIDSIDMLYIKRDILDISKITQ